jgi:hypothetical protein
VPFKLSWRECELSSSAEINDARTIGKRKNRGCYLPASVIPEGASCFKLHPGTPSQELHDRRVSLPDPQTWLRTLLQVALLVVNHLAARPAIEVCCSRQRLRYLKTKAFSSFRVSLHPPCYSLIFLCSREPNTDNGSPTRCFRVFSSSQYRASRRSSIVLEEAQSPKSQRSFVSSETELSRFHCRLAFPFLSLDSFGQEAQPKQPVVSC